VGRALSHHESQKARTEAGRKIMKPLDFIGGIYLILLGVCSILIGVAN
jgi:hypothetical protein